MRRKTAFIAIVGIIVINLFGMPEALMAKEFYFDGPPPICPRWAFEPWVWEDYGNTKSSIMELVDTYEAYEIPVGAVIIDSPWEATPGQSVIGGLNINDTINSEDWSIRNNLQAGDQQYGDRTYRFTSIPDIVAGSEWIRTANDSKVYTDGVANFTLEAPATVYIAHDERVVDKPGWLMDEWDTLDEYLYNDEQTPVVFRLYKKNFDVGDTVVLEPNTLDGDLRCGMYTVIVQPDVASTVSSEDDSTQYNSYQWDRSRYPEAEMMIDDLHDRNIRVILWATGIMNTGSEYYEEVKNNYCYPEAGNCATSKWWKSDDDQSIHIDFRKEDARTWFKEKIAHLIKDENNHLLIDGWKCDMGADMFFDSSEDFKDLQKYYYASFYRYSKELNPEGIIVSRAFSHQLSGNQLGAPISDSPINWQGDFCGDFKGISDQMMDVYHSAEMNYSAPGVEIGGYLLSDEDDCAGGISTKSLIRYAQFGALTPLMLNGGKDERHEPWHVMNGEEATNIYRYYATLHSELVPYIFSYGVEAHQTGTSILRDTDRNRAHHKLGNEIFVSILTDEDESKNVLLPQEDRWIDYWSENQHNGGETIEYALPDDALEKFPIFIRAGAIIPMNVRNNQTNHGLQVGEENEPFDPNGKVTLNIYPSLESEFLFHQPLGDGTDYRNIYIAVNETEGTIDVNQVFYPPEVLEAEDGIFQGEARIIHKDCMSGKKGVGWLGNNSEEDNHLEFFVNAAQPGEYVLTIDYVSGEEREADMRINGAPSTTLSFESTGNWESCGRFNLPVGLTAGENTIRFFNDHDWAPDIDKITIRKAEQTPNEYILRVKSFNKPENVSVSGAEAFDWFYRQEDDLVIAYVKGVTFTLTIDNLRGYGPIVDWNILDEDNKKDWSIQNALQVGDLQYGDRNYAFTSVPDVVSGAQWFRTANDSKAFTDLDIAGFTLGADATVYIAHDERAVDKPEWLVEDWASINDFIQNDEQPPVRFELFRKQFAKGSIVSLGPNTEDGFYGYGMYSVIVVPTIQ